MSGYNERKLSVLECLKDLGEARAYDVADYLGIRLDAAKMALSRYHYQRLLNRTRGLYQLSEKGFKRLEYLRTNI